MKGKDHINISVSFVFTLLVPLFFISNQINMLYPIVFIVSVFIGSLLPDTDCGGKATIYYKFPSIHHFMKNYVGKIIIYTFNKLISKRKLNMKEVKDEHRGIVHSPTGILLSSFILSLVVLIIALIIGKLNLIFIGFVFGGLIIGQFLHLFEDSCTISGIDWGFPFKKKLLKGKIKTFDTKDKRPKNFAIIFYFIIALIVVGYSFDFFSTISTFFVYSIIIILDLFALFLIKTFSKMKFSKI